MKNFFVVGILASVLFAYATSSAVDCNGVVSKKVCRHLNKLERKLTTLVLRSSKLITSAVEESAQHQTDLFVKTVQLLKNSTSSKKSMNATELVKLIEELKEIFEKAEKARDDAATNALAAIQEASLKVAELIQKVIAAAADDDRSDLAEFQERLKIAIKEAHVEIKLCAYHAIDKVNKGSAKVEKYVVKILKKLGFEQASNAQTFVDALSDAENNKLASKAEEAIDVDFDSAADEAYQLIVESDQPIAKRFSFRDVWDYIKSKINSAISIVTAAVKSAIQKALPLITKKIKEVVQILINTAKEVLISIAGEIFLVTAAPSLK